MYKTKTNSFQKINCLKETNLFYIPGLFLLFLTNILAYMFRILCKPRQTVLFVNTANFTNLQTGISQSNPGLLCGTQEEI